MHAKIKVLNGSGPQVLHIEWRESAWMPRVLVRTQRALPLCFGHRTHPTREARLVVRYAGLNLTALRFGRSAGSRSSGQSQGSNLLAGLGRSTHRAQFVCVRQLRIKL